MHAAEAALEKLQAEIARLDATLADPDFYARDPARAKTTAVERGQLAKKLERAEETWMSATTAFEEAQAEI
jgi:ATP-binding cassette subfamily F protein 3